MSVAPTFSTPAAIAGVGLRRLSRDRVGLFFTFLLPMMIIVLLGAAIPSGDSTIGVVDADGSALSAALIADVDATPGLAVRRYASPDRLRDAVRREQVNGGLVVPAGYQTELRGDAAAAVTMYVDQASQSSTALRTAVSSAVGHQAGQLGAVRFVRQIVAPSPPFDVVMQDVIGLAAAGPAMTVEVSSAEAQGYRSLTIAQYTTAGELVLFVFLIALAGAGELVETRRLGISRRMLASPTTARQVILGEGLNRFLTAGLQVGVIVAATAVFFGLSWGNPIGVALVVGAFALVSVGAGLLMGAVARTNEQATSFGPIVGISLGMLGGCMWPLEVVPKQLRTVGHLTPHAWALDGLIRLMGEGRGPADVFGPVAALLAFAAVLVPVAAWQLHRSIVS